MLSTTILGVKLQSESISWWQFLFTSKSSNVLQNSTLLHCTFRDPSLSNTLMKTLFHSLSLLKYRHEMLKLFLISSYHHYSYSWRGLNSLSLKQQANKMRWWFFTLLHKCRKKRAVVMVERSFALSSKAPKFSPPPHVTSPLLASRENRVSLSSPPEQNLRPSLLKRKLPPFQPPSSRPRIPPLSNGTGAAATCPPLPLPLVPQWSVRTIERDQRASPHAHPWYHCLWMPHECPFLFLIVAPLIPHV